MKNTSQENRSIASVLITGGAGFVGTHLCRRLKADGYSVTSIDLKAPKEAVQGVEYILGDVRDQGLLSQFVSRSHLVYHLAATVSVPLCQKDPLESYSNNFQSTLTVLETIRQQNEKTGSKIALVFASTAAIYGKNGDDGRALSEDDVPPQFLSFYAAQKHASEKAIELYASCYQVPAFVFRFFNIFGPGQDPTSPYSGVITLFSKFAREGRPIPLNDGGYQTRDFISVYDIANACADVLKVPLSQWNPKPMNLGSGTRMTVRELGEMIRDVYKSKSILEVAPAREGDVTHSLANIDRARKVIGFRAEHELRKVLLEI